MLKRTLKILVLLILALPFIYISVYYIQNLTLKESFVTYNEGQGSDSFIRCNSNIFEPEFVDIYFTGDEGNLSFKKTKMLFQSDEQWRNSRIGGTTVTNTTFEELVKMVKKDCSQFQYGYANPDPEGPRWTYTGASSDDEVEAQEPTEEERRLKEVLLGIKHLTEAEKNKMIEHYGPIERLTAEELIEWWDRIDSDVRNGVFSLE
jgi:hypothetical protein